METEMNLLEFNTDMSLGDFIKAHEGLTTTTSGMFDAKLLFISLVKNKKVVLRDANGPYIKDFKVSEFVKICEKEFGTVVLQKTAGKTGKSNLESVMHCEDSSFYVYVNKKNKNVSMSLASSDQKKITRFNELAKQYITTNEQTGSVQILMQKQRGYEIAKFGDVGLKVVKDNYEEKLGEDFDYIVKELKAIEPSGRLTIIDGPPGTGKSYFIRGLIKELVGEIIVVLPSKFVSSLDSPTLIPVLLDKKAEIIEELSYSRFPGEDEPRDEDSDKSIILIIEDADECLVPRSGDNMSAISSLLNFTDGIFGSVLNMRIIATTNAKNTEFDKAITRPGRLSKQIHIGKLHYERALHVYKRLKSDATEDDLKLFKNTFNKKDVTLAEVYAFVKGVDVTEFLENDKGNTLGFGK